MTAKYDKPSKELIEKVFYEDIASRNATSKKDPFVIFVAGIAGSGKSYTIFKQNTESLTNIFIIQPDNYRILHPKINQFIEKYGVQFAHERTGSFSNNMAVSLKNKAIESRLNVLRETTFGNIETAKALIDSFKNNGYRIIVLALPADLEKSLKRNKDRFDVKKDQIKNNGMHSMPRLVPEDVIRRMKDRYDENIRQIEKDGVRVIRPGNSFEAAEKLGNILKAQRIRSKIISFEESENENCLTPTRADDEHNEKEREKEREEESRKDRLFRTLRNERDDEGPEM